jgi:integrase
MPYYVQRVPKNTRKPYAVRNSDDRKAPQVSFETRREAEDHITLLRLGIAAAPDSELFGRAVLKVIDRKQSGRTRETYRHVLAHLACLMSRSVSDVARDYDGVADLVAHHHRGKSMLRLIRETCCRAPGYVLGADIAVGRPKRRPPNYYDAGPAELEKLAQGMGAYSAGIWLMALAELRISEMLAVTGADVDLDAGTVTVSKQRNRTGCGTSPLKGKDD